MADTEAYHAYGRTLFSEEIRGNPYLVSLVKASIRCNVRMSSPSDEGRRSDDRTV